MLVRWHRLKPMIWCEYSLIDKNITPGISICSAGGVRIAKDRDAALAYLKKTNAGTTPEEPLAALAEGMTRIARFIEDIAEAAGAKPVTNWMGGTYPFEGYDTFGFISIIEYPGVDIYEKYPHVRSLRGGTRSSQHSNTMSKRAVYPCGFQLAERPNLPRWSGHRCCSAYYQDTRVRAPGRVILAVGGLKQMPRCKHNIGKASRYCLMPTLVIPAMAFVWPTVGADLWHMWHYGTTA